MQIHLSQTSHQFCASFRSSAAAPSPLGPTQQTTLITITIIIIFPWPTFLALFLRTACWLRYTSDSSVTACLPINHNFLLLPLAQSQDPANQRTWLMELSLLLTTWAPLSCCLRGTLPRTYAWCRPRKLSAGSRYSKSLSRMHAITHYLHKGGYVTTVFVLIWTKITQKALNGF